MKFKCETCQNEATISVDAIGCHFCASCIDKIDERIRMINSHFTRWFAESNGMGERIKETWCVKRFTGLWLNQEWLETEHGTILVFISEDKAWYRASLLNQMEKAFNP